MKKINLFVLVLVIAVVLSLTALSQLNPITNTASKIYPITSTISLEEKDICTTSFFNDVQDVYSNCVYYYNYTSCLNSSGPNTACSLEQNQYNFKCKTGETTATSNKTECRPSNNFVISIDKGNTILKKQIDFSDWGPCIYSTENNCLIVTCVSNEDGAFKGQFTDCKGGKSCQKFVICDNSIKTFYKNSREDFVESDPTFFLDKLAIQEVGK